MSCVVYRDEPIKWNAVITEIRTHGFGTGEICIALNVPRGTLRSWEIEGCCPNYEDGKAILLLLAISRKSDLKRVCAAA